MEEIKEYVEILERSIQYFESMKKFLADVNLRGLQAHNVAIKLMQEELDKQSIKLKEKLKKDANQTIVEKVGTKIKIIRAQEGAFGANNRIGIVCEKPEDENIHGLVDRFNNNFYVIISGNKNISGVWNIGKNAKYEIIA